MALLTALKKVLNLSRSKEDTWVETVFVENDDNTVQDVLAPVLRQAAIDHLRKGQGVVAKSFRGEYLAAGLGNYKEYLAEQSRDGAWGTYIEAAALGEAAGCNVVVTPVKSGVKQKPICLYRAADAKAPTVHLYNSDNKHWYVDNKTKGRGNCLFNAFAQAFKTLVTPELPKKAIAKPSGVVQQHFLNTQNDQTIIEHQRAIDAAIKQHPTPAEKEADLLAEQKRIKKLPRAERAQIANDHALALKLAREEMGYATRNVFDCRGYTSHIDSRSLTVR